MCSICGCGQGETRIDGVALPAAQGHGVAPDHGHDPGHDPGHDHEHVGADGRIYRHSHADDHLGADRQESLRHRQGREDGAARLIRVERDLLAKNAGFAAVNRRLFEATGSFVVNLMSSPGSGKTTLLARTLIDLKGRIAAAVIEGDQQTSFDAERIRATGTPAIQINTGKGCHLDAQMITQAVGTLAATQGGVLFIENVGNLVCPAGFDLGETRRVVVLSVTEGEDKPLKYPEIFATADLLLINKIDLLPHLTFDLGRLVGYARRVKPSLTVIELSATGGQGLEAWYAWIEAGAAAAQQKRPAGR
ncbi:MAG: hydrogenase nickel incorporation protein HypB [Azospirillum sp.]|nr:hydrogenase nickel incorporation protein HypB [Azospirillum sp.]